MAVPLSFKCPALLSPSFRFSTRSTHRVIQFKPITAVEINGRSTQSSKLYVTRAIEEGRKEAQSETSSLIEPIEEDSAAVGEKVEVSSELGKEIKQAMEEKSSANDLLSGVLEEVREIEWPAFQKVLGTTGVVLGVIAGSSVVLLTVNAVLAELSDKVFAAETCWA
uniref:Uncharacterized protein n=1 Tax=Kalanchoe fedtschenkoi TaxID=63787 RepID=A0A7N0TGF5_KALFE